MSVNAPPDYSAVVSATGFLRPRASRSITTFHERLLTSHRILTLTGAGLSAPSGLHTYRGAGGLWRTHDATQLCTPTAFAENPALVWEFHLERLQEVEQAMPNAAHYALAELARKNQDFLVLTMNVDDLSEKAAHAEERLWHLHGKLQDVKCTQCDLHLRGKDAATIIEKLQQKSSVPLGLEDIPRCPTSTCQDGYLRPGVIWFNESLPRSILASASDWINSTTDSSKTIDIMLVIGTSALVYPATAYIEAARKKGARVAIVDIEKEDPSLLALEEQDWYFQADAAVMVPDLLKPIIGEPQAAVQSEDP